MSINRNGFPSTPPMVPQDNLKPTLNPNQGPIIQQGPTINQANHFSQFNSNQAKEAGVIQLSNEIVGMGKSVGLETPEKLITAAKDCFGLMDDTKAKALLEKIGKAKNGVGILQNMAKATQAFGQGNYGTGATHVMDAAADAWPLLPKNTRANMVKKTSQFLQKIPKLGGFAPIMNDLESIGATPSLMKMTSGALRGDSGAVTDGFKGILEKVSGADAATAGKVGLRVMGALGSLLPKSTLAKIGAKKIPVISLLPAAWDGLAGVGNLLIGEWGDAGRRFLSAGSGAASTVPGWGTAASVGIDLGLLTYDVVSAAKSISNTKVSSNPFQ